MLPSKNKKIQRIRDACRIAAEVLESLIQKVSPGISTYEIDQEGKKLFEQYKAKSACYQYQKGSLYFPSYTCLSVNDAIVHGTARKDQILQDGDIITIDVSVVYRGFVGDNARTVAVGSVTPEVQQLMDHTKAALFKGIAQAKHGNSVNDISGAIEDAILPHGYSIVREYVGHGVGKTLHEEPQIPNYRTSGPDKKLKAGMTLAIEPMVNLGGAEIKTAQDGWTVQTKDQSPSAHFEHTVLVGHEEPEILTLPAHSAAKGL